MTSSQSIPKIVQAIRDSETICIVGHIRPDGDCIGSQLGLAFALQNAGKKVTCWNEDAMPDKLSFLDPKRLLQQPKPGRKFDCVIATDCASFERLGKVGACIQERKIFINIDQGGRYFVRSQEVTVQQLGELLKQAATNNPASQSVIIRGDKRAAWDFVATAMRLCNQAGIRDYSASLSADEP